jgi:hypothetical protein
MQMVLMLDELHHCLLVGTFHTDNGNTGSRHGMVSVPPKIECLARPPPVGHPARLRSARSVPTTPDEIKLDLVSDIPASLTWLTFDKHII